MWNVLTAVGERTTRRHGPGRHLPVVPVPPGDRRPGRRDPRGDVPGPAWLGLGSGEALNEHVIAGYWPEAGERSLRMFEAIELIKKLFDASIAGKDVKHAGRVLHAWRRPGCGPCRSSAPPILVATAGPINAKQTGKLADGIITVGAPLEKIGGPVRQVRRGRARGGQGPGHDAEGAAAAPVLGADRRGGAGQRDGPSGPTAA